MKLTNNYILIGVGLVILVLCSIILTNRSVREGFDSVFFHQQPIVVSRYNEDLAWITQEPFNRHPIIVYNKGTNNNYTMAPNIIRSIQLPNVGRESHTYLYHIINNYDSLADVTIFLPGSIHLDHKYGRAKTVVENVEKTNSSAISCQFNDNEEEHKRIHDFTLDTYTSSDEKNRAINNDAKIKQSEIRPYGLWFNSYFTEGEKNHCVAYMAMFGISKDQILQRPKSFYERLLATIDDHHNPEVGHYMERSWYSMFYPYNDSATFV